MAECRHGEGCELPWGLHDWSYEAEVERARRRIADLAPFEDKREHPISGGEIQPPRYVIHKASRSYDGGIGYTGPSWERAGLPVPTAPFDNREDAEEAVRALDKVNAVGWVIAEYFGEMERHFPPLASDPVMQAQAALYMGAYFGREERS